MSRYLTAEGERAALILATVLFIVGALIYQFAPTSSSAATKPRITYVECAPGGVHAWTYGDDALFVIPAGGDCP